MPDPRTRGARIAAGLGLLLVVAARPGAPQDQPGSAEQLVYADSLANGWRSQGTAEISLDAGAPVHFGSKSISISPDAYQLWSLIHVPIDSSIYTNLTFWIHGGSSGGQRVRVVGHRNYAGQSPVTLTPLAANAWQRITIPLSSLGIAGKPDVTGVWIQSTTATRQPVFFVDDISLTMAPPPAMVRVNVDAGQIVRTVEARHFGVSTSNFDPALDSADTVSLLTENANQALRFPGSNDYHWASSTTTPTGTCTGAVSRRSTSFDEFARVATATQAQVFITANYGSGTPAEAADWVRYSNVTQRYGFTYWEVGNENYGSWETDCTARRHDPFIYATRFKEYFVQMKAVDPTIKVGAVVATGEDSFATYTDHPATNPRTGRTHNGWTPVMLSTLRSLGVTPDFVIHHRYDQSPGSESDADLLQSAAGWANDAADLRQQLADYLGAEAANVELVCTENNSVSSRPGKQTTSLVSGLFLADSTGQVLQTEFNSLIWHQLREGRQTANNNASWLYGWRQHGTYGLAGVDYNDPTGPFDRNPTYYVSKLLQYFARGGDQIVRAASDFPLLSIYAARRADGSLTLLVINKSSTRTVNATIALAGYAPDPYALAYTYGMREDEAARTGAGSPDLTHTSIASAAETFGYAFPAYSVTVIALTPSAGRAQ